MEFIYNNSYHLSTDMVLFEVLYGRYFRFLIGWFETSKVRRCGTDLLSSSLERVWVIYDRLELFKVGSGLMQIIHFVP